MCGCLIWSFVMLFCCILIYYHSSTDQGTCYSSLQMSNSCDVMDWCMSAAGPKLKLLPRLLQIIGGFSCQKVVTGSILAKQVLCLFGLWPWFSRKLILGCHIYLGYCFLFRCYIPLWEDRLIFTTVPALSSWFFLITHFLINMTKINSW